MECKDYGFITLPVSDLLGFFLALAEGLVKANLKTESLAPPNLYLEDAD